MDIQFKKGKINKIKAEPIEDGSILVATDDNELYMDFENARIKITDNDKLNKTELNTAINSALKQAKESGEFDGVSVTHSWDDTTLTITSASGTSSANLKGNDGESISITNITESTIDGDKNTISFSDGNIISIKNGNTGKNGYTPIKGEDYFTNSDKTELINEIVSEINTNTIPEYVITESERVISEVIEAQGSKTFTFAAISDLHYGNDGYTDGVLHATQALKYIDERIKLDAIAVLGDYTDGYPATGLTNAINDFKTINSVLNELRFAPNLRQQGNHDYYKDNFPITHRFIQAYSDDVVWGDKLAGYYYKDFNEYKLRIISINTIEEDNSNIDCSAKQYKWFVESLDLSSKEDMAEWQILILSHHPMDWYTNDLGEEYWYRLPKILNGYVKGLNSTVATGYGSSFTPAFDFSKENNKAKIICNIHGHIHNLLTNKIYLNLGNLAAGDTGIWRMATPEACINRSNQYSDIWKETETYNKIINTAKDTSFIIYCIDLNSNIIKAICYGAGYNRVLNYITGAREVIYAIVNNLTNVTTNNNISSIEENSSYTATLTPSIEGDMTITVTMGGVDITSSAYKNGVITIDKVTGNVIITAAIPGQEIINYSVTNDLTRTVLSNRISSIEAGQPYSTTVSANYTDQSYANAATVQCTVTMGGVDVTSNVYSDGTINIPSVTGDIVITAYAYVNMIPFATDKDGNLYNNGQGWQTGTRLGSDGTERTDDPDMEVIGFIPIKLGDIIYFKNLKYIANGTSTNKYQEHEYLAFYNSNKAKLDSGLVLHLGGGGSKFPGATREQGTYNLISLKTAELPTWNNANNKWTGSTNMAYFRISAQEITEDSIITINEKIK